MKGPAKDYKHSRLASFGPLLVPSAPLCHCLKRLPSTAAACRATASLLHDYRVVIAAPLCYMVALPRRSAVLCLPLPLLPTVALLLRAAQLRLHYCRFAIFALLLLLLLLLPRPGSEPSCAWARTENRLHATFHTGVCHCSWIPIYYC